MALAHAGYRLRAVRVARSIARFQSLSFFFKNYTATYGSLDAAIILLTWFYLSGLMLLVGAEIDAVIQACKQTPPSGGISDQSSEIAA